LRQDILAIVYAALDDIDAQSLQEKPVEKTAEAPLLGSDGGVDSLTIVNLVVAIEERIQTEMGKTVVLVDEDNLTLQEHPFRTVGTLAEYVEKIIDKH
jgi:acyl carrier protein